MSLKLIKKFHSSNYVAAATTKSLGVFISTPKKIFPRAVDRNKIKRRIKAALFEIGYKPIVPGLRLIVRKDFLALTYKEAYNEIDNVIKKVAL